MEALITKLVIAVSIGFQVFLLFLLLKRRLQRRFLWFLVYIAYELLELGARLSTSGNKALYFNVYWLTAIGGAVFSVLAVRESFLNVFRIYTRFRWFTRIVWGCVAIALMYSVFKAWAFPPVHASRLTTIIIDLELAVNYCLSAVGLLYFVFVRFHKIRQHQWESAIISGFTTIGAISVLAGLTRSVFGTRFHVFSRWAEPVAFILAEIEWSLVLARPEKETPKWITGRKITEDDLTRLDQYVTVLERILGRK